MINKAINTLVLATVDSLKKFKNKLAYYLAIFAMVFGSTFGTMNSANAVEDMVLEGASASGPGTMVAVGSDDALLVDGSEALSMLQHAATLTLANNAADQIFGAVTATTGKLTITSVEATDAGTQTFSTYTGTDSDIAVVTAGSKNHTIIFTGAVTTGAVTGTIVIDGDTGDTSQTLVQVGGNLTGVVSLDDNAGTVTLEMTGADTTIGQAVNSVGGDQEAILKLTGANTTVAAAVGTASNGAFQAIDINGATSFSAASEAAAYTVDADATFTGVVTANTGFTINTSADVTLSAASDLSLATVTTGTLTSNALLTTSDLINTAGKVYLNATANEMGGGRLVQGDGSELHLGKALVTTNNVYSSDDANGEGDFHSGSKIFLPSNFTSGETLTITDAGAWDAAGSAKTAVTTAAAITLTLQDTALVDYTASAANAGATVITITAADKSSATIATELGITSDTVKATLQLMTVMDANDITGDTAAYDAYDNALNARGFSATEDTAFVNQVSPQTDTIGGSSLATRAMTGTVQGIVSNRMASLRSGDAFATGMSAGNGMSANSGFVQVFGSEGEQKNTSSSGATVFGFDSETSGVAFGFDGMTDNGSTVGLSASYSSTDVNGKGTGKSENSIDSYTVSVYADKATENGYIEGSLTYGINDNAVSRLVNTAGLNRSYSADYDSNQISLKVGGGVPNEVADNTFVTPFVSATATTISTDAYTEKSTTVNDALRLKVAQDDINSLVGSVGVKAHRVTDKGTPMISLAINNEFGDSKISSNNTYQGGGTKFLTTTEVEELSATLGLGYSFGNDATSLNINYEANVNDDEYVYHYGSVKIVAKF